MELYLQFGYGMMEHCRHLIEAWGGGTAVLSPRDLNADQLTRLAGSLTGLPGGRVLLDPQFYLPYADNKRLCEHEYWPSDYSTNAFWQGPALAELLAKLAELNESLGASAFILPGLLASVINDDWFETQRAVMEEASTLSGDRPLYMTIALSADATRDQDQVALLLERAERWTPAGFYLVCEHPNGSYLVEDPNWLANVLDIAAGLRLRGARVVIGYCNHQMLAAACTRTDAICSGTWMNVRSFPPDKFRQAYDEEMRQRATWYYCPQALSEYKIPFLDIAHRLRLLDRMAPPARLRNDYSAPLFSGPQPSAVGFTEQAAFRHYLHCLRLQCEDATAGTFDDALSNHEGILNQAETLLATLTAAGIRGHQRDFTNIVDANRAALAVLSSTRAPILRRRWTSL